jgi:molybdopterin-containing oxidoreductase family iron-sulfur binding subunit
MSRRLPYEFQKPEGGATKKVWRSLEEKLNPDVYAKDAAAEFPKGVGPLEAGEQGDKLSLSRRGFVTLGAITAALAAEGCARRPVEKILPYSKAPEYSVPGLSYHYATVHRHRGDAIGLLVESHDGRPTKIEGNPTHPSSLGATDATTQATIFDLYDPDRSRGPRKLHAGLNSTWAELDAAFAEIVRTNLGDRGARLRILAEPTNSPTFQRVRDAVISRFPLAKFHTFTPVNETEAREGSRIAFGQSFNVLVDYAQTRAVLSVDSDFLGTEPGNVRATKGFSASRRVNSPKDDMARLYVVEPVLTTTGATADHRLRLAARDAGSYLLALAKELMATQKVDLGDAGGAVSKAADVPGVKKEWIVAVAKDLAANKGKSAIVVGSRQPAWVHALAHAVNVGLGNAGQTVSYFPVAEPSEKNQLEDLKALTADIEAKKVGTLLILGGNPVYDAPQDVKFEARLREVQTSIHLSSHLDETSELCSWHIPLAHELETWGDQRALDGTRSIQQPLIAPLFGARSEIETLARLAGDPNPGGHDLVKATIKGALATPLDLDKTWNNALKRGILQAAMPPYGAPAIRGGEIATAIGAASAKAKKPIAADNVEVSFAADPKLLDGRHANNMWLQELPDLLTKITWDNVAQVSPGTAKAMDLASGDVVRLSREAGQPVDVAVWIQPGTADNVFALTLGWGRQSTGRYGKKHGFNVYPLRTTDAMGFADGVKVQKLSSAEKEAIKDKLARPGLAGGPSPAPGRTGPDDPYEAESQRYKLSQTQDHDVMEGRPDAIDATLAEYRENPRFPQFPAENHGRKSGAIQPKVLPLWSKQKYEGHKWGMAIDLNACTGCNACVIACQAENNIPSVGKEQIERGREMFWIRLDRYFTGEDHDNPQVNLQPVACVHCEEAPCENVCPVNATEHSPEGLNDMAYNRCIGTRYCANNCPYKVRRFNFLNYNGDDGVVPDTEKMHMNPNVTVRMRGVMEKCSYCVQRIEEAKIASRRDGKPIKENDPNGISVVSACQQVCPADAIAFGDLNDKDSRVANLARRDRNYYLLADLGTAPRTSYLGKLRNPNPEMG